MKRWIHGSKDLNRKFVPPYDEDNEETTVADAIDAMTYSVYDSYKDDSSVTFNLILEDIIEHLEAADLYGLKEGQDFDKLDVAREMDKYDWSYINENRSVRQWIEEDLKGQVKATTTYMNSNGPSRVKAREILKKYTPDQIALVQKCNDDLNAEISKQFAEDWDPEVGAINLNSIKTDWLIEAIEDDLLTEEEFEELLSAIDVLDTEAANAYA